MFLLGFLIGAAVGAFGLYAGQHELNRRSAVPTPRYLHKATGTTCELVTMASQHDSPMLRLAVLQMRYDQRSGVDWRNEAWPSEALKEDFELLN